MKYAHAAPRRPSVRDGCHFNLMQCSWQEKQHILGSMTEASSPMDLSPCKTPVLFSFQVSRLKSQANMKGCGAQNQISSHLVSITTPPFSYVRSMVLPRTGTLGKNIPDNHAAPVVRPGQVVLALAERVTWADSLVIVKDNQRSRPRGPMGQKCMPPSGRSEPISS